MPPETRYKAPYVGEIGDFQYRVIGGLLGKGRGRLEDKFKSIGRGSISPDTLFKLCIGIEDLGEDRFLALRGFKALPDVLKEPWQRFQGAVCEVVCFEYLDSLGEFKYRDFVSTEELVEGIRRNKTVVDWGNWADVTDSYIVVNNGLDSLGRKRRVRYPWNDGYGITKYADTGRVNKMDTVYEFKSTKPHFSRPELLKRAVRLRGLLNNETVLYLMNNAFADIYGIDVDGDEEVEIVPYNDRRDVVDDSGFAGMRRKLVIVEGEAIHPDSNPFAPLFPDVKVIGMPSVRGLAYFTLRNLTGRISHWQDQFIAVRSR